MATPRKQLWRYIRGLAAPLLLWGLFITLLVEMLPFWLHGDEVYDEKALREWIDEARIIRKSLPQLVRDYVERVQKLRQAHSSTSPASNLLVRLQAEEIEVHLQALASPPTKMYPGQLPLFPMIYRLEIIFDENLQLPPICWDSELPRHPNQYRELIDYPLHEHARLYAQYQMHAYNKRHHIEQDTNTRLRWVSVLAVAGTLLAFSWMYLVQRRERNRQLQRMLDQQQIDQAERLLLEEELRRREAERRHEEAERKLLEQRLATQAAERRSLELKSQLYASIGIMAGSYAHNIKNLLVRPNDLLRRCLDADGLSLSQGQMLHEVQQTLGTVTERLQQILRTVHRDPNQSEMTRLDLNAMLRDVEYTWRDLTREKWKLELVLELSSNRDDAVVKSLQIEGDWSHLQQAVENLLFNARDATFEMRNHLREQAHHASHFDAAMRRQALIAAAGWRGRIILRTHREGSRAILEVQDNGIGMTEEVLRHCTETHFSTKRDNALYEGHSTGMGLGLSFVEVIVEHHHATLMVESEPLRGTLFRISFPLAATNAGETVL